MTVTQNIDNIGKYASLTYLMSAPTPYWIGLGSSEQDEVELPERTVIMALTFYAVMAVAVYILIFGLFYLFFCEQAQLLKDTSDDEVASKAKKRKEAKKIKKKKSAKRKPYILNE